MDLQTGTLVLSGLLVLVTLWYAKTTHDILQKNSELAAATERLAEETRYLAKAASDSLYLEAAPILRLLGAKGSFNKSGSSQLFPRWANGGKSIALNILVGVVIEEPDGKRFERTSVGAFNLDPGEEKKPPPTIQVEWKHVDSRGRSAASFIYFARYYDIFQNRYESRQQPDGLLDVRRMQPNEPMATLAPDTFTVDVLHERPQI